MKRLRLIAAVAGLLLSGCTAPNSLYQYSTINALLAGDYDGDLTYGELRRHGDFGLGTFKALDGEMVALDGNYYQVRSDGKVLRVADSMQTPFAVVTFFRPDHSAVLTNAMNYIGLQHWLDQTLPNRNAFYAIKVHGDFDVIIARSVPRQQKPYPLLIEASKKQAVFEFHDVAGTLVGFRTPEYAKGVNVSGYHFHFISDDQQSGGHVLSCRMLRGKMESAENDLFLMVLPKETDSADWSKDRGTELEQVEKGASRP